MKQAYVNGTDSARPSQRSPVSKRGWGWKHLEDYKGYLYFIERESFSPVTAFLAGLFLADISSTQSS
jgi:hypothetical protein